MHRVIATFLIVIIGAPALANPQAALASFDVPPSFTSKDKPDISRMQAIFGSKFFNGNFTVIVTKPHRDDLPSCQFGVGHHFPAKNALRMAQTPIYRLASRKFSSLGTAPFLDHVIHVVLMASKEKMAWADAQRGVTVVTNKKTFRDFTKGYLVGKPMCRNRIAMLATKSKKPISVGLSTSFPEPARISFYRYVFPKAIFWILSLVCASTRLRSRCQKRVLTNNAQFATVAFALPARTIMPANCRKAKNGQLSNEVSSQVNGMATWYNTVSHWSLLFRCWWLGPVCGLSPQTARYLNRSITFGTSVLLWLLIPTVLLANPQIALSAVLADSRTLPPEVACRTRYLYAPQGEVMQRQVKFWSNLLSREVDFGTPRKVGADVCAVVLDDYRWDTIVWDKQINSEPFFYYLLREYRDRYWCLTPAGKELVERTHTRVPIVWADWWLFYRSRQVDLNNKETGAGYADFLGFKNQKEFESLRFLDDKIAVKIGDELEEALETGRSRVTNFGVERRISWRSTYGDGDFGFWITNDSDDSSNGNTATGNLKVGEFKAKAREAFTGLPNGLVAFGAFNAANGNRQATVPDTIASARHGLHQGNDLRIHPYDCAQCHRNGALQAVDGWARNRGLRAPNQLDAFKVEDYIRLKRQYFRDLDRQLAKGRLRVNAATKECVEMTWEQAVTEHATTMYGYIRMREPADVAALLGVTEECLTTELRRYFAGPDYLGKKRLAGFLSLIAREPAGVPVKLLEENFGDLVLIVGKHK